MTSQERQRNVELIQLVARISTRVVTQGGMRANAFLRRFSTAADFLGFALSGSTFVAVYLIEQVGSDKCFDLLTDINSIEITRTKS